MAAVFLYSVGWFATATPVSVRRYPYLNTAANLSGHLRCVRRAFRIWQRRLGSEKIRCPAECIALAQHASLYRDLPTMAAQCGKTGYPVRLSDSLTGKQHPD